MILHELKYYYILINVQLKYARSDEFYFLNERRWSEEKQNKNNNIRRSQIVIVERNDQKMAVLS